MIPSDWVTEAVSWRRHLHKHPELAFQERNTSDFIAEQLGRFGLKVHRGLAGTGVVGTLVRGTSKRSIAIRADMDALPIQEQSGALHTSGKPGVMHACGHDGHIAMALAAARACAAIPDLDGTVHFVFQPAEEARGGARTMIEDGLFRLFPCDAIYGLHNWPDQPLGTCVARDDAMMAALALFEVTVNGQGCHAAMPHEGRDSLVACCQLVSAFQTIVSRNTDPLKSAVVSVTQIHAGDSWNAIPHSSVVRGTARWFDQTVGESIERRISALSNSIAIAFGCNQQISYDRIYPVTVNDPTAARQIRMLAASQPLNLTVVEAQPSMASEDFAFMLQAVPGCYFWLGTGRRGAHHALHSPSFDFNDDVLPLGVAFWVSLVQSSLART